MQEQAAPALYGVAQQTLPIGGVVDDFTGTNLQTRFTLVTAGSLVPAAIAISHARLQEGASGETFMEFTVQLAGDHDQPVTVNFSTHDDLATADDDYSPTSGTLTWAAGDNSNRTIQVAVRGDDNFEPDESFIVLLSDVVNAAYRGHEGFGYILNDDMLIHASSATPPAEGNTISLGIDDEQFGLGEADETLAAGFSTDPLRARFDGQQGINDKFVLAFSETGARNDTISFHGGGGGGIDSSESAGGNFDSISVSLSGSSGGLASLALLESTSIVTYYWTGLESFAFDVNNVSDFAFDLPAGITSAVLEDADPTDADPALAGKMRLRSPDGHFVPMVFNSPNSTLTIRRPWGGLATDRVSRSRLCRIDFRGRRNARFRSVRCRRRSDHDSRRLERDGGLPPGHWNGRRRVRRFAGNVEDRGFRCGTNRLNVLNGGSLTLAGTLDLTDSTVSPQPNSSFTIIDNQFTAVIAGAFNGLAEGATVSVNGVPMRISYVGGDGNDVVLVTLATLSATLVNGDLTIADADASGKNNTITISVSGSSLVITDTAQPFLGARRRRAFERQQNAHPPARVGHLADHRHGRRQRFHRHRFRRRQSDSRRRTLRGRRQRHGFAGPVWRLDQRCGRHLDQLHRWQLQSFGHARRHDWLHRTGAHHRQPRRCRSVVRLQRRQLRHDRACRRGRRQPVDRIDRRPHDHVRESHQHAHDRWRRGNDTITIASVNAAYGGRASRSAAAREMTSSP